jgi:hypothetical protein
MDNAESLTQCRDVQSIPAILPVLEIRARVALRSESKVGPTPIPKDEAPSPLSRRLTKGSVSEIVGLVLQERPPAARATHASCRGAVWDHGAAAPGPERSDDSPNSCRSSAIERTFAGAPASLTVRVDDDSRPPPTTVSRDCIAGLRTRARAHVHVLHSYASGRLSDR